MAELSSSQIVKETRDNKPHLRIQATPLRYGDNVLEKRRLTAERVSAQLNGEVLPEQLIPMSRLPSQAAVSAQYRRLGVVDTLRVRSDQKSNNAPVVISVLSSV